MGSFKDIFKELRNRKKLTQDQLSTDLELSRSAISMYERGEREPDFETLEKIADYFNVDMNYLLGKQQEENIVECVDEITFDDFTYAMFGESKELTDEQKNQLLAMAKFLRSQNKNDN